MVTKLVPIGKSRGIRIPKAMLKRCGFENEVRLSARSGALMLRPHKTARVGWTESFQRMSKAGDDVILDPAVATAFDRSEWQW